MKWFDPEFLEASQKETAQMPTEQLNVENDFGSYAMVRRTSSLAGSKIKRHNDINPKYRITYLKSLLPRNIKPKNITDMGCGLGITANELHKQFPDAKIFGYDVSKDAIQYAEKNFKGIAFSRKTINKDTIFENKFGIIFALEFYPFTRTLDIVFQKNILDLFMDSLLPDGIIVIHHRRNCTMNVERNLDKLSDFFKDYDLSEHLSPNSKIYFFLRNKYISNLISQLLEKIFKKNLSQTTILIKKRKSFLS